MARSYGPQVDDYASAEAYLEGGRTKTDRPLCNNTRLERLDADTIGVRLHSTYVVEYHRDGSFTIRTGGWWTVTTKDRIHRFSPARVGSYRFSGDRWSRAAIFHPSDPPSPPRVQRCRQCHGLGGWPELDGPGYGYSGPGTWEGGYGRKKGPANLVYRECWHCGGRGRYDYGSNPVPTPWNGGAIRIDATGRII